MDLDTPGQREGGREGGVVILESGKQDPQRCAAHMRVYYTLQRQWRGKDGTVNESSRIAAKRASEVFGNKECSLNRYACSKN